MSVRLPSADHHVAQVAKEQLWLPVLAPQLALPIPAPLAWGEPRSAFPRPWSVYQWTDGDLLTIERVSDLSLLASDLAGFLIGCTRSSPPIR
jgi:aminoglycoside phosphotransferase (APT) family kinase protein